MDNKDTLAIELEGPAIKARPARPVKFESEVYYFYGDSHGKRYTLDGLEFGARLETLPNGVWESWVKIRCLDGRYAMNSARQTTVSVIKAQRNGAQPNAEKTADEQYNQQIDELLLAIEDWSEVDENGGKAPIERRSLERLPAWLFAALFSAHTRTNSLSGN